MRDEAWNSEFHALKFCSIFFVQFRVFLMQIGDLEASFNLATGVHSHAVIMWLLFGAERTHNHSLSQRINNFYVDIPAAVTPRLCLADLIVQLAPNYRTKTHCQICRLWWSTSDRPVCAQSGCSRFSVYPCNPFCVGLTMSWVERWWAAGPLPRHYRQRHVVTVLCVCARMCYCLLLS